LALAVSSIVLHALAPVAFVPALLAPVPLLIALRALPFGPAVPLVLVGPSLGRSAALALGWAPAAATSDVRSAFLGAVLATVVGLIPLLCDKVAATWLRRAGFLAYPCAVVVLDHASRQAGVAPDVYAWLAPPHAAVFDVWSHALSTTGVVFYVAGLASVLAGLGAVGMWQVPDPYPQRERERGLLVGTVAALFSFFLLAGGGGLRLWAGHAAARSVESEALALVCAALGSGLLLASAATWFRHRAASATAAPSTG
jgi:hypothetical protein